MVFRFTTRSMRFLTSAGLLLRIYPIAKMRRAISVLALTKTKLEFSLFGLLTERIVSASLVQATGEKGEKFMSKQIRYTDEPIGDIKLVADFLPSPKELKLKSENTKITITLSSESIAYFKQVAKENHMQYQKMIRQLLDEYVAHQKKC
jgi:predicted DNA binding CopG/RHH family protein